MPKLLRIYRGESVYNRGGRYWTTSREWARQFTQTGRDREVRASCIRPDVVYRRKPLPSATSEREFDAAMAEARRGGYAAFWVDEGAGEPDSIYVLRRTALVRCG